MTDSLNGISRPLYLDSTDTAAELGVSVHRLKQLSKALDLTVCEGGGRGRGQGKCRYERGHILRLRALQKLALDLECTPAVAGRIQRAIAARKAANGEAG